MITITQAQLRNKDTEAIILLRNEMLEQLYNQYFVHSKDECIMIGDASGKS